MPDTPQHRQLQSIAQNIVGPGVQVRDPEKFAEFLNEKSTQFRQQQALRQLAEQDAAFAGVDLAPPVTDPAVDVAPTSIEERLLREGRLEAAHAGTIFDPASPLGKITDFLTKERPIFEPLIEPEFAETQGRRLPGIAGDIAGPVLGAGAQLTSPFDIALIVGTAGLGRPIAGSIRGAGTSTVRNLAAGLVEPLARTFPRALAAEAAVGTGAVLGATAAGEALADAPAPVRIGGALVGGLTGGVLTLAAPAAGRRVIREAGELAARADLPQRVTDIAGAVLPERRVFAAGSEDTVDEIAELLAKAEQDRAVAPQRFKESAERVVLRLRNELNVARQADAALDAEIAAGRRARAEEPPAPTADEVVTRDVIDTDLAVGAKGADDALIEAEFRISNDARLSPEQKQISIEAARLRRAEFAPTPDEQNALNVSAAQGRLDEAAVVSDSRRRPIARTPQEVADQAVIAKADTEKLTRLIDGLREIEPSLRADLEVRRSVVRRQRVAEGVRRATAVPPEQKRAAFLSAQAGELPSIPEFEALRTQLLSGEIDNLYSMIYRGNTLRPFEQATASKALTKLLQGEVPTPNELIQLQKVFGRDLVASIENLQKSRGAKAFDFLADISGLPRGLLASYDISAVMRQGGLLTISHPNKAFWGKNSAFVRMMNALVSEDAAKQSLARIEANPKIQALTDPSLGKDALFIRNIFETDITKREEAFISRFIQRIPGIRASERAFSTYLNEITTKVGEDFIDGLVAQNIRISDGVGQDGVRTMAKFLNVASGRGTLGVAERSTLIKKMATVVFWSPRLLASRIQVPIEGIKAVRNINSIDPAMRAASRQIARDIAIYVGGMTSFLWMLKLSNLAEVEVNPFSSDFGKIRVGNTRLDTWGGFQQIARYTAQIIWGRTKRLDTGEVESKQRARILGQFIRSKLAPGGPSTAATFLPQEALILPNLTGGGRTFIGERVEAGPFGAEPRVGERTIGLAEFSSEFPFVEGFIVEQLLPLFGQDIQEALKEDGLLGASLGLFGVTGIGVTSFDAGGDTISPERRQ